MNQIHNLRINNFINIDSIDYEILNISVIKTGKCFRDHYGNNYLLTLKDKYNNKINIIFNNKTINNYIIKN